MEYQPNPATYAVRHGGLAGAVERGDLVRHQWRLDGTLLSPEVFATRRGVTAVELSQLEAGGQLFSLEVGGARWYPAELLRMSPSDEASLCAALDQLEPTEKLIFLMRDHGALGGVTVAAAVAANGINRVLALAAEWRAECVR